MLMPTSPREKLVVKILAGVLGLFVVFTAMKMVAGGGSGSDSAPSLGAPSVAPSGSSGQKPPKGTRKRTPGSKLTFTGVDPFEPLIAPAPSPEPTAQALGASPAAPTAQPGPSLVVQGTTLTLAELPSQDGVQMAHVLVDGILYQLVPGDTFGDGFTLTSVTPPCADFAWGQESFRLCLSASAPS